MHNCAPKIQMSVRVTSSLPRWNFTNSPPISPLAEPSDLADK